MRISAGYSTDIGRARERQEDAYLMEPPLYAVADGMGGHRGGDIASALALETLAAEAGGARAKQTGLAERIQDANRAVFERSLRDHAVAGMGTTLTAALVDGSVIRLGHVGDSRAYLLRAGTLRRLTEDHTLVHQMVREGQLTEDEAGEHPQRSVLTRALGTEERVRVDEGSVELRGGDRVLLCTDGLTAMIGEEEIQGTLERAADPQRAAEELVLAANEAGGIDNVTAIVLDIELDETDAEAGSGRVVVAGPGSGGGGSGSGGVRTTWIRPLIWAVVALGIAATGIAGVRVYVDRQWYVGVSGGHVAVYRGIPATVAGVQLHHLEQVTSIPAARVEQLALWSDLPGGITADNQADAAAIISQIRADLAKTQQQVSP